MNSLLITMISRLTIRYSSSSPTSDHCIDCHRKINGHAAHLQVMLTSHIIFNHPVITAPFQSSNPNILYSASNELMLNLVRIVLVPACLTRPSLIIHHHHQYQQLCLIDTASNESQCSASLAAFLACSTT